MLDFHISLFDKICFVVIAVSLIVLGWYQLLLYRAKWQIKNGNFPPEIEDFPMQSGDRILYKSTYHKIEEFSDRILSNEQAQLSLSEAELNVLVAKGYLVNKYEPGTYVHYQIEHDYIEKKYLNYFSNPGVNGCWTRTWKIKFHLSDDDQPQRCQEFYELTEEAGRPHKNQIEIRELNRSSILEFIFGVPISLIFARTSESSTADYQRGKAILNQVKTVQIIDKVLHISNAFKT